MIDRFGKEIVVGFAAHEILWIEAALKLPRDERTEAFQDIAAMTGRTEFAIRDKAKQIRYMEREAFARMMDAAPRRIVVPSRSAPRRPVALASEFAPPSKARLMGARA